MANGAPADDAEALFDTAPCGLLVTAPDGLLQRVNSTFCDWVGRTSDELVGRMTLQALLTMGGRIFHQTHWAPLMQIQGSVAEVKFEVLHTSGRRIPMVFNAVRRGEPGQLVHQVAAFIAEDRNAYERELLQQRQRAEALLRQERLVQQALAVARERLRLAIETARLQLWDIDLAKGVPRYEDGTALLLGHGQPRPVSRDELLMHLHPEDREAESAALARALDPADGHHAVRYRLLGVDGVVRTVNATGHAVFDREGTLENFVGVLHDVSDIVRQEAEALDRALLAEQMIGIVSHDLRNPLSAIRTCAEVLRRSSPTPTQQRTIERLIASTGRAGRLVDDLLDFTQARLRRGLTLRCVDSDVHATAARAVDDLRLAFPEQRLDHVQVGPTVPCRADADRLEQAIGNLVSNAVTYGDPERPITLTSTVAADRFMLAVHNHGTPISEALMPTLFDAMSRGDALAGHSRSVGLGLFIVREIARAHGGRVDVESTVESGTTFTLSVSSTSCG